MRPRPRFRPSISSSALCLSTLWLSLAVSLAAVSLAAVSLVGCRAKDPRSLRAEDFASSRVAAHSLSASSDPGTWRSFGAPKVAPKPLKVLSQRPVGNGAAARSITVVFNQPMVRLGAVRTAPLPIRITPALRTTHRWPSGDTLKVELLDRLRPAQMYTVTIPASLSALSGKRLGTPMRWSFASRRPRVRRSWVLPRATRRYGRMLLTDQLLLATTQAVDPSALASRISLRQGKRRLRFSVRRPSARVASQIKTSKRTHLVLVVPAPGQIKLGGSVRLRVAAGWRGSEGPLPSRDTYGPTNSRVVRAPRASITCNRLGREIGAIHKLGATPAAPKLPGCWAINTREAVLTLSFAEPVTRRALLRALRITPAVPRLARRLKPRWNRCGRDKKPKRVCSRVYRLEGALRRYARYDVRIAAALRDVHGRALAAPVSSRFRTHGVPPGLFVTRSARGLRERWRPVQIKTVNTRSARVRVASYRGVKLARLTTCLRSYSRGGCVKRVKPSARLTRTIDTKAPRDRVVTRTIKALPPGLNIVTVDSPEVVDSNGKRIAWTRQSFQSAIGLHTRLSPYGLLVWVTSLDRARPLGGKSVALTLRAASGRVIWRGAPGPDGTVLIGRDKLGEAFASRARSGLSAPKMVLLASTSKDLAYLPITGSHFRTSSHPGSLRPKSLASGWSPKQATTLGHISVERGIYRPGERVYMHGAVRRYVGWRGHAARAGRVVLRITNRSGDTIATTSTKLGALGGFVAHLSVPRQVRLGTYYAKLRWQGRPLAAFAFRVAAFRAPRFFAQLLRPHKSDKAALCGAPITVRGRARYFHGAPLDGAAYRLTHRQQLATSSSVREHPGFSVGNGAWSTDLRRVIKHTYHGVLDARGDLRRALPTQSSTWPASQRLEVSVRSPAHRRSAASTWRTIYPARRLAAVKRLPRAGRRQRVRLLVVSPAGVATRGSVRATLHAALPLGKRRRYSYYYRRTVDFARSLWSRTVAVSARGATLSFRWPRGKRERLYLRLATRDGQGREAHTLIAFSPPPRKRVRPGRTQLRMARLQKQRDGALRIRLDKKVYRRGDVARVTIERRGLRGDARLFVERERTFRSLRLRFQRRGGRDVAQVSLPVDAAFFPSVTLRAVALRAKGVRSPLGPYAVARATLALSNDRHRLSVALSTDKKRYQPRQTVRVRVRVRDARKRGRRAQVVLMAVDESVLRLTRYSLPNPYNALSYAPDDSVKADDLRRYLVRLGIPVAHVDHKKPVRYGSGAGYGRGAGRLGGRRARAPRVHAGSPSRRKRSRIRRNFVTTPWHAMIVTDARGEATTTFTLPDNLTRFRIMAFAVDATRGAGTGTSAVTVDLPLTTLAALPRFMRVGDRAYAGVVVGNGGLASGPARVTVKASGAIAVEGVKQRTVNVARGRSATVRFWLRARRAGAGTLRFTVALGKAHDAIERTLVVQQPVLMEAASVAGQTKTGVAQGIEPLGDLRRDRGGLTVTLSSTALTGVDAGLGQLISYPYGCLEQKSSKLLAMIAAAKLSDRFAIKLPGKPKALIRGGLLSVLAMQRHDGGFGYWPQASSSSEWGTAYALIVLHRAAALAGVPVPAPPLLRALRYLTKVPIGARLAQRYSAAAATTLVYALALYGRDVTAKALQIYKQRRRLPLFARAQLLMALVASKAKPAAKAKRAAIKQLLVDMQNSLRVEGVTAHAEERLDDGYKLLMHSNDRTTAMVLQALLAAQPDHPLIPRMVRWFVSGRKKARFRNTQEAAWALMAMWDYARVHEKHVPDFEAGVWLGRRRVLRATFAGRKLAPHVSKLAMRALHTIAGAKARKLTIAKRGRGTLYYTARLRYARKDLPRAPRSHGFTVKKRVLVLDRAGRPLAAQRPPRLGDTVAVILDVSAPDARRYVVIDDPLPAGLEAIDTALRTSSRFGASALPPSARWSHRELRDDRVLFFYDHMTKRRLTFAYLARVTSAGAFIAPPTKAEEMYTPEVFGHTAARTVRYVKP